MRTSWLPLFLSLIGKRRSPFGTSERPRMRVRNKKTSRPIPWFGVIAILGLFGVGQLLAQENGVRWLNYREALEAGVEEGRPIFLYFYSDSCAYCKKMEADTLRARPVVEYLKDTFVAARIHAGRYPHLARKYMVRGLPTSCFLSPGGKGILALPGYLRPDQFIKILRYVGGYYRRQSLREYLEGS